MTEAEDQRKALIERELARVRDALPPLGARVLLAEVARRAELDETTTLRRLAVLCAAQEAVLENGDWVKRRKPAREVET